MTNKKTDSRRDSLLSDFVDHAFKILGDTPPSNSTGSALMPAALAMSDDKDFLILLTWNDEASRTEMLRQLGEKCYKDNLLNLGYINDGAMKAYETKPDANTDLPLMYPPSMRKECLILMVLDFMDSKNNYIKIYPYKRNDKGIIREADFDFQGGMEIMDSSIMSNISFGFVRAAMLDLFEQKEILDSALTPEIGDKLLMEALVKYPGATLGMDVMNRRKENEGN